MIQPPAQQRCIPRETAQGDPAGEGERRQVQQCRQNLRTCSHPELVLGPPREPPVGHPLGAAASLWVSLHPPRVLSADGGASWWPSPRPLPIREGWSCGQRRQVQLGGGRGLASDCSWARGLLGGDKKFWNQRELTAAQHVNVLSATALLFT